MFKSKDPSKKTKLQSALDKKSMESTSSFEKDFKNLFKKSFVKDKETFSPKSSPVKSLFKRTIKQQQIPSSHHQYSDIPLSLSSDKSNCSILSSQQQQQKQQQHHVVGFLRNESNECLKNDIPIYQSDTLIHHQITLTSLPHQEVNVNPILTTFKLTLHPFFLDFFFILPFI